MRGVRGVRGVRGANNEVGGERWRKGRAGKGPNVSAHTELMAEASFSHIQGESRDKNLEGR